MDWSKRFVNEYLPSLEPRRKWHNESPNLAVGTLVLLKKENAKRHLWPLARVVQSHIGRDGNVRSVTLKDEKGKLVKRPIQNIVNLKNDN